MVVGVQGLLCGLLHGRRHEEAFSGLAMLCTSVWYLLRSSSGWFTLVKVLELYTFYPSYLLCLNNSSKKLKVTWLLLKWIVILILLGWHRLRCRVQNSYFGTFPILRFLAFLCYLLSDYQYVAHNHYLSWHPAVDTVWEGLETSWSPPFF